jgi:hypothetical protein
MIVMAERERARDALLVIRCQQGEPQAYEELVRVMERRLFSSRDPSRHQGVDPGRP